MDWSCGSGGRAPALQVQNSEFKSHTFPSPPQINQYAKICVSSFHRFAGFNTLLSFA
jgi:hypothetical protein